MKKTFCITAILIFGLIIPSYASDYAFGTKVTNEDNDLGRPLKNIPDGTIISYWDIGPNLGAYDSGDIVYLDTPPIAVANSNDLRLSSSRNYKAGTKLAVGDIDMNAPLLPMKAEVRFLNLNGSQSYDLLDPVYIHQSVSEYLEEINPRSAATEAMSNPVALGAPAGVSTTSANIASTNSTNVPNGAKIQDEAVSDSSDDAEKVETDPNQGFREHLSYTGCCSNLPQGAICLKYSDNFIWLVSDRPIDVVPYIVGVNENGWPIEAIRCNNADYYHILGTLYVKSVPKDGMLYIQSAKDPDTQNMSKVPATTGYSQSTDAPIDSFNKVVRAINRVSANSDSIRVNDVRITTLEGLVSGTKVLNLDPDLNKLVAFPVLVSFPGRYEDYACVRVYDKNGNGLYDAPDDIYLDISFPGSSSFGTVVVNDVRLSGPS